MIFQTAAIPWIVETFRSRLRKLFGCLPFPAAVLAIVLGIAGPCRADVAPGMFGRTIRVIEFVAEQSLERANLDAIIGLKPGDTLSPTGVKGALQALYDTGRFSMIAADADPEGENVRLRFQLRLNYYFNRFEINGPLDLRGRLLSEVMPLPVGERFTPDRLEQARQAVLKYLREQGYFQADVAARTVADSEKRQIDTFFLVRSASLAVVRAMTVTGVPDVEENELRRSLQSPVGKKYQRRRVMRRLTGIRENFIKRGYLAAVAEFSEVFEPADNTILLNLNVSNFGKVRVVVDGFKVEKSRLQHLLPVLSGEGIEAAALEQGVSNLRGYLEEGGFPEAVVEVKEETDKHGTRLVHYLVKAGRKVTVALVQFQGNLVVPESDLLASVQIQPVRFGRKTVFSKANLNADVESLQALYQTRGYLEAKVDPQVKPLADSASLGITYVIEAGRLSRTKSVGIIGNRTMASEVLAAKMQLRPGGIYSPQIAERDRQTLLAAYNDAGFLQARVNYQAGSPDNDGGYAVEYQIDESIQSRIDQVIVLGNRRTRESLIEKRIKLRPNDPLSLGNMLETQQALYSLGIFDRVKVSPQNPDSVTPFQNVVVRLDEAQRFTLRYGLGYQQREKVRATVELSQLNILGTGQRADLRLRVSGVERLAGVSLQQPQFRFLPVNSYFTFSLQRKQEVSYNVKRLNFAYQYSYGLNRHSWGLLRYNYRKVRVFDSQVEPIREDTPRTLSTISAIYINDTRDNYLDPEKGFFTSTDLSLTTKLLGSNSYYSLFSQSSYFRRLRRSAVMAASLRFGFAIPFGGDIDIPISERFFAGGASSLRGFETDSAGPLDPVSFAPTGGNSIFVGNLELRTPPWHSVFLAGFYDTGNVFRTLSSFSFSDFSHSAGLGIRIKTPFGPLRADYGYNLNLPAELRLHGYKRGHFFITIGSPF